MIEKTSNYSAFPRRGVRGCGFCGLSPQKPHPQYLQDVAHLRSNQMTKIDLKKQYKHLYLPSAKKVTLVEAPLFNFAMVDGEIQPGSEPAKSQDFQDALQALYGISYGLKFKSKLSEQNPIDYTVMALEGLWWFEGGHFDFNWDRTVYFTAMMMQPDHITSEMFQEALGELEQKKPSPALGKLRFETFEEGLCMQIMHIGPYADEPATIEKMMAFAGENGCEISGKHHEIYIGDPRRAKPEKLKTVLRYPVRKI